VPSRSLRPKLWREPGYSDGLTSSLHLTKPRPNQQFVVGRLSGVATDITQALALDRGSNEKHFSP
jgi:hypothetical protein